MEGEGLNDRKILDAVHVYYQSVNVDNSGVIEPECAYLVRNNNKVVFIMRSRSLG